MRRRGDVVDEMKSGLAVAYCLFFSCLLHLFLIYRLDRLPAFLTGADGLLLKVCRIRLTVCRLAVEGFRNEKEHLFMLRHENLIDFDG